MMTRDETVLTARYRVRADASAIAGRARALAIEQSVEMPLDAIADARVLDAIVARVRDITPNGVGQFIVTIEHALEAATTEIGQIFNMLFGNSSLHDDVTLEDVEFPQSLLYSFPGPGFGIHGLRDLVGAPRRALTASALKPIGLPTAALAQIAHDLALGGIDLIKDDHGLANQALAPFAQRVPAVARAIARANASSGQRAIYAPSLSGNLDQLRAELAIVRNEGVGAVLVAPMVVGLPTFACLVREAEGLAILAHPSLGGAMRIAPQFLFGKVFRMLGADATIFPNYGGRFSYDSAICLGIAAAARVNFGGLKPALPMPAGGMTLERVPEMLNVYGNDCALLIGGALLSHRENLAAAAQAFAQMVRDHGNA